MKDVGIFKKSIISKVEFLLKNYPSLRNNDTKLWISYLVLYHNLQQNLASKDPCQAFCDIVLDDSVPGMGTIRRVRQKFQETGKFPKTGTAAKQCRGHKVRSQVEYLLKTDKDLRDDDKLLWLTYLVTYHDLKTQVNNSPTPYEALCDVLLNEDIPAIETIRRTRQAFQEQGLYLGEKRKQRLAAAKRVAKYISKA